MNIPSTSTPKRSKRGLTFGLTAGLIGGTAAGMVFGVPGLSGAADDASQPAALVQQVDDAPVTDAAREPGDRIREVLQALVDDNTISAEQADAVTAHLVENRPDRGDRGPRGRHGRLVAAETVIEVLGIDAETLREQLRDGNSLADVATANGVDPQVVVDALVDEAEARLATALEEGKIDEARHAEITAELDERITARVNGERPDRGDRPGAPGDAEG